MFFRYRLTQVVLDKEGPLDGLLFFLKVIVQLVARSIFAA